MYTLKILAAEWRKSSSPYLPNLFCMASAGHTGHLVSSAHTSGRWTTKAAGTCVFSTLFPDMGDVFQHSDNQVAGTYMFAPAQTLRQKWIVRLPNVGRRTESRWLWSQTDACTNHPTPNLAA